MGSVHRPSGRLQFTWCDCDGDSLRLRQGKSDKLLTLPCTVALKAAPNRAKGARPFAPMPNLHIVRKQDCQCMTCRRLAEVMLEERPRLALTAYGLHALRYRGVMELAWAGCNDDKIYPIPAMPPKR